MSAAISWSCFLVENDPPKSLSLMHRRSLGFYFGISQKEQKVKKNSENLCYSLGLSGLDMNFDVPNQVSPLHAAQISRGSRITSRPFRDSSESDLLASSTNWTASSRFSRASSSVAPGCLHPVIPLRIQCNPPKPSETQP